MASGSVMRARPGALTHDVRDVGKEETPRRRERDNLLGVLGRSD